MKAASIAELKKALQYKSQDELKDYCLQLARFKVETKELLTYLVFEKENEEAYRNSIKDYLDNSFEELEIKGFYYLKKSVRKILRQLKRFIRYSKNKETEAVLLMHFCRNLSEIRPSIGRNTVLRNMYYKQIEMAEKAIAKLHPDLQYDLKLEMEELPKL